MITKEQISTLIQEKLEADDCFLVDLKISTGNKITVLIDSMSGISIDYCIQISRLIEGSLDREVEDFELEVSTPGLGQALKVKQQYVKNIGREVEVTLLNAAPHKGILTEVTENGFTIEEEKKVKIEGKKKKELKIFSHNYTFDEIKSVKVVISF
ncbi:ribosome assembly cofactor RimP [Plebeiibacterium sediminum]|uniref:Ribosome maturation factor RimP n=1 Tax=Plebeiibacterium sediminum TaxID=2992112 RepID=A0AAE3M4R4_9BACT|nr:ribosome assembly cofactor RimP [Plebeiobacterium sediminum]MCW3787192.1 ribosome assembly cofactor RimP [Plebeiobacterium sediminum]